MRRTAVLVGSIAVHVAAGIALLAVEHAAAEREERAQLAVELVDVTLVAPVPSPPRDAGGGTGPARPARPAAQPARPAAAPRPAAATRRSARQASEPALTTSNEPSSASAATRGDAGSGGGRGGGHGHGIGLGDGGGIEVPELPPPPPAAPLPAVVQVSRARPARLIYPSRNREVSDSELFIARVTVDDDGYVVGARIVRGFGDPRDDQASNLIWRFRYAPALDDAGRAIRSTLDQGFLVGP